MRQVSELSDSELLNVALTIFMEELEGFVARVNGERTAVEEGDANIVDVVKVIMPFLFNHPELQNELAERIQNRLFLEERNNE